MKLNRLDTHDRLDHFVKDQAENIFWGAEDCLKRNKDSLYYQRHSSYVYLFAHPRTLDLSDRLKLFNTGKYPNFESVPTHKMTWQPRLTKPTPQTNSYLFRAESNTDNIEVCWLLPPRETWKQAKKGNMTENELVIWSIDQFTHRREEMGKPDPKDLPDHICKEILRRMLIEANEQQQIRKVYDIPGIDEEFQMI
jgi:hypothetical protein